MAISNKNFYFKNLDGLRFLAAFGVVLTHCSFFKNARNSNLSNVFSHQLADLGGHSVKFFFVLSGFLISYILLNEFSKTRKINIKKFYIKRILRIWPLYFLVGIGGTLLSPFVLSWLNIVEINTTHLLTNLFFLFTFSINLQLVFFYYNREIVEILWSVCIEEQFYLLWPWLLLFFRKKIILPSLIFIIVGILSPFLFSHFFSHLSLNSPNYFFSTNNFLLIGMGCLFAHIYYFNYLSRFQNLINNKIFQILIISVVLIFVFNGIHYSKYFKNYYLSSFEGALFGVLILIAISKNSIITLENKLFKELGKISYGIYLYHTFVAQFMLFVFAKYCSNSFLNFDLLYPFATTITTFVISYFSFYLFESKFLSLKNKL